MSNGDQEMQRVIDRDAQSDANVSRLRLRLSVPLRCEKAQFLPVRFETAAPRDEYYKAAGACR